jgi:hypothetical protein
MLKLEQLKSRLTRSIVEQRAAFDQAPVPLENLY